MPYEINTLSEFLQRSNEERHIDRADVAPRVLNCMVWHAIASFPGCLGDNHEYVEVVEVCDLDSGCGFRGAVLIEERSINIEDKSRWNAALNVIGASLLPNGDIDDNERITYRKNSHAWRMCIVYALNCYGYYDENRSETVQPDPFGPLEFDSWHATRIRSNGLRSYVRREFLGLRR
jgi:hypothetical protein